MSAIEVVIATAITVPAVIALAGLGVRLCRVFFSMLGTMVGAPYM